MPCVGSHRIPEFRSPAGEDPAWRIDTKATHGVGVDLRYSPFPKLSLDLTLNTHFVQVEADDQQVNLTRVPLFLTE
jgi:hypothetical protein